MIGGDGDPSPALIDKKAGENGSPSIYGGTPQTTLGAKGGKPPRPPMNCWPRGKGENPHHPPRRLWGGGIALP